MIEKLDIKKVYSSNKDNLLKDFYNPVLKHAVRYSRITGYFSPSVFAVCARGLSEMISDGGKIRIVSSVELDKRTYDALEQSQSLDESIVQAISIPEDPIELRTELQRNYYDLFVALLKKGVIELKIAVTASGKGILHEKIGIIEDSEGYSLTFSGSNNETVYGWTHNIENFKVFKDWDNASAGYFQDDAEKFEKYWNNESDDILIFNIDDAVKQKIFKNISNAEDNTDLIIKRIKTEESMSFGEGDESRRKLRDYQKDAISHWQDNDYNSIFEMATGSGKTFTALKGLKHFRKKNGFLRCVIVVPLITLLEQWSKDIREIIDGVTVISASGANPEWSSRVRALSQNSRLKIEEDFIIVTTYSTFSSGKFISFINDYDRNDLILLADEMHNLVTESNIKAASSESFGNKLGLSATPTRLWKPLESNIVRNLFGDNSFVYSLEDAINDGALVKYNYYAIPVILTEEEFEEYSDLSKEASRLSYLANDKTKGPNPLATILTKRAAIKKQAENKLIALEQLIERLRRAGDFHSALIYVDSNSTLTSVQKVLTEKYIKSSKFTGVESLDKRSKIIKSLESKEIEAIVAIKCLDEGVDIPSATRGIFLSNNTDPREYIQRLGRVLRRHDDSNKELAYIYDFIVIPPGVGSEKNIARNLVKAEVVRAKFFEGLANNAAESKEEVNRMLDKYGFYFEENELDLYNNSQDELNE